MSFSTNLFETGGRIAEELEGYEVRPQQVHMLEAVEEAIASSTNLIAEAGTGVGKSLAYLVPFIDWAYRENKRVVISTYTKALQNQLFVKDLPFLKRVLGFEFKYALCMGSENYVCLRKAREKHVLNAFSKKTHKKHAKNILKWLESTETGLVTDMEFIPDRNVWDKFSRESDMCLGRKCVCAGGCFYIKAREEQARAHVLVTNHALLFTNMTLDTPILPDFHGLVLDEAHTLEDIATAHFSREVGSSSLKYLLEGILPLISNKSIDDDYGDNVIEKMDEVESWIKKAQISSNEFFEKVRSAFGEEEAVRELKKGEFSPEEIKEPLERLAKALTNLSEALKASKIKGHAGASDLAKVSSERVIKFLESLDFIFDQEKERYVFWIEIKKWRGGVNYSFHAAPIDIDDHMRTYLFENICPVVLTSATLSSSGTEEPFAFLKKRLGIDKCLELPLDSPFDYANNVMLYLPRGIADPNKDFSLFQGQVQESIINIYDIMGGRIFALFTSYDMLNKVSSGITSSRGDINILKQGDLPRYVLLDVFRKNHDSILMGTMTFWQGVDVAGSALECVVITKLPFSVPTDPINASRIKSIRSKGLNPFTEYQLPQAVIMFKQGFGRLIRSHSDRGIVAILDPRVRTRYYGKKFINAIPSCRKTDNTADVHKFFKS